MRGDNMNLNKLTIFRELKDDEVLSKMCFVMNAIRRDECNDENMEELQSMLYDCIHKLVSFADEHGFYGNIWHVYITYLLVNSENTYSKACEMNGAINNGSHEFALSSLKVFKKCMECNIAQLGKKLNIHTLSLLEHYAIVPHTRKTYNHRIATDICTLAVDLGKVINIEQFQDTLTRFYKEFGVGKFGLHKAFRISEDSSNSTAIIKPITNTTHIKLDDLVLYDIPKQQLINNTLAFVEGRKANNCLLFGDAGTGKSSCVKAILHEYYSSGLRIIEVYKHQFKFLNDVIDQIKNRNYKFIIYMDDLSFEDFEVEYKYLKAVIEGGLEKKPSNILIYATSNRRHLIREEFGDKVGLREDLHASDTVQEKLSLAARFGESIFFNGPSPNEFREIVKALAKRNNIDMEEEQLLKEANTWEMQHNGRSGRSAQQFIDHLLGRVD